MMKMEESCPVESLAYLELDCCPENFCLKIFVKRALDRILQIPSVGEGLCGVIMLDSMMSWTGSCK